MGKYATPEEVAVAVAASMAAHLAALDPHAMYLLADGSRALTGNMAVTATKTIDGRDLSIDGSKLDGVEAGATKYPDTGENAYSDAEKTKLAGVEAGATKYPDAGENAYSDAEKTKLAGVETGAVTLATVKADTQIADLLAGDPTTLHQHDISSLWEKGLGEALMPAEGEIPFIYTSGLFEEDADGNFRPKLAPDASIDAFFTLNGTDDIQPSA